MTAASLAATLAQLVLSLSVGWIVGDALLEWAFGRRDERGFADGIGWPERALLAIVGWVAFAVAIMVVHLATGGLAFGFPIVVPVTALAVLWFGRRRLPRLPAPRRPSPGFAVALAIAVVIAAVYAWPMVAAGTGARTGDMTWHLGWTEQLLAGEPVPTGPAAEFARNGYPWGWHATAAALVRVLPGSDVIAAHDCIALLLLVAIPLAAACLARRVDRRSGWGAAFAVALIGGFGWVEARGPAFVTSPSAARYGADLVVASPNSAYDLFAPAFPRELGLVLLGCGAMLVAIAYARPAPRRAAFAGAVLGCAGLVSVPMLVAGSLWAVAATPAIARGTRLRIAGVVLLSAAIVFGLWASPVAVDYLRLDGFVNVSPGLGVEWPIPTALAAWGLLLPLAVVGLAWTLRRRDPRARALVAFAAACILLLALTRARDAFDWNLAGNATLLHQGRVWPVVHLLAAAFAGVACVRLFAWLRTRSRPLPFTAAAVVVALAVPSLWLASRGFTETLERHRDGFEFNRPDHDPDSFLRRAAARLDPDDVVEVRDNNELAFMLFAFSGARMASYDDPRLEGNDLRIRFAEPAAAWDARIAGGGFVPDYEVAPASLARDAGSVLESGAFEGTHYVLLRAGEP